MRAVACGRFVAWLVLATTLGLALRPGGSAENPAAGQYLAFVGTYTDKTSSRGIYAYRYDTATGKMAELGLAAETPNPSWLAVHPNGQFLYAVNESGKESGVSAFRIDSGTGKLTLLNHVSALGEDPCYISFDRTGKYVFVANYTSGNVVVFPIDADGKLGTATANVRDQGKLGPNRERQEGPHAHWIEPGFGTGSVYVADLGLDRIVAYDFDVKTGTLSVPSRKSDWALHELAPDPSFALAPGTGPRHAVLPEHSGSMYVLGEVKSTITVVQIVGLDMFKPTVIQRISTLPKDFSGRNDAAEIVVHANGKFLYASNRGSDSIAVFSGLPASKLKLVEQVPTGGKEPRHFALDPSGQFLLAENQLSDNIVEFRVDAATGKLTASGETVKVPSPVCLVFVPTTSGQP